jgi:ABC-type nickel/cobalt efflux system permease component RcnA
MTASFGGILLGLLVGLRHAFEPDHLTAVSTLVTEAGGARRGLVLGAIWGVGHTISLLVVGVVLLAIGAVLPAHVAALFECGVSAMLIALGIRAIVRAAREGRAGPITRHSHGRVEHVHAGPRHVHVAGRTFAWRPLVVGLVHGLAGSGALTALVFAELPTTAIRIAYIVVFGLGSVAGMAIASGVAGASLRMVANGNRARRTLSLIAGTVSIVVGIAWGIPMLHVLIA